MTLTVGELVAYAKIDRSDFKRGTRDIDRGLKSMQDSTSSATAAMERDLAQAFAGIAGELGDAFDPAEALADIERLAAGVVGRLDAVEDDAGQAGRRARDSFIDELRRYGDISFDVDADIAAALASLAVLEEEAEKAGQRAGERFMRGADGRLRDGRGRFVSEAKALFDDVADGAGEVGRVAGGSFVKSLGAMAKTSAGPALIGALAGVAAVVGPAVGAAAGAAIVAGIGGKLVALGVQSLFHVQEIDKSWSKVEQKRIEAANKQAEKLKAQFDKLGRDITIAMQDSSQPLLSVIEEARVQTAGLADDIGPKLKKGFQDAKVPLESFVRDAAAGMKELSNSIPSLMDGFGDVLGEIDIKGLLSDIGDEFEDLGKAVSENRATIGTVLNGLLDAIPIAIDLLTKTINFFGDLGQASIESAATITEHMSNAVGFISDVGTGILNVVRSIGQSLSNVPGMEDLGQKIVDGADAGINKLTEFKTSAAEASRAVRLTADITGLQKQIDVAMTELDDPKLKAPRRAELNAEISQLIAAKGRAMMELNDPALIKEYRASIKADISDLKSRLADARKELKDPELTKERKAELKAEIAQLKEGVARGKEALDSVKDKTVKVDADGSKAVAEVGKVGKSMDGLTPQAQQAGRNLGAGLSSGIRSMIGDAVAAAKSLAASALQGAKDFLGIKSPSTVMADVGKWTVKGLIQGLRDEESEAVGTVKTMVGKIKDAFKSQPDVADGLVKFVSVGNDSLAALARQREELVERLANAKEMAKQVAGDAKEWAAITGLDPTQFTGGGDLAQELTAKASAINNFANNIKTLAARGLNKAVIQQIIDAGVEKGASFAEMLVGSDGSEIKALNKAQAAVDKASKKLGKTSADAMYDVGKKSGDGYLKGLQESLKKLDKEMEKIVKSLVAAIKKHLKIKSPSQVMHEIGQFTMQGLNDGMASMLANMVATAQSIVGQTVAAAKAAAGAGGMVAGHDSAGGGFLSPRAQALDDSQIAPLAGGGVAYEGTPKSGVTVNVDMSNSVVREEPDIDKIGNSIGFKVLAAGLT